MGIFGCQNTPNPPQTRSTPTIPTTVNNPESTPRPIATSRPVANNQTENTTATNNLRNQIIANLEKNFSNCSLKVKVRGNNIIVTGTVPQENNRQQIQDLVNSIAGVNNNVSVNVTVASA